MSIPYKYLAGVIMFFKKTQFYFQTSRLIDEINKVDWNDQNRCVLNEKTGNWLYDTYTIKQEWKDTVFAELLDSVPYRIGEARLMKLEPQHCYRAHADVDDRYHLNIISNPYSFLIDLESNEMHSLKEDGFLYRMDGGKIHTAVNLGSTDRIQLVIRVPLTRNLCENNHSVSVIFPDPPANLRYVLDQTISPLINKLCKTGEIGFFDIIKHNQFYLEITNSALCNLEKIMTDNSIKYKIE